MSFNIIIGIIALIRPLAGAAALVIFMSGGKNKPAPTQTELEERKKNKAL
jgi:flagellar basal body-associated protein FliL